MVFSVALVIGLVLGLGNLWALRTASTSIERLSMAAIDERRAEQREGVTNILAVGFMASAPATVTLIQLDASRAAPIVVSFPGDLKVEVAGQGDERLAEVHATGGGSLLVRVVEDYIGFDVDHYVEVEPQALGALVDAVGGVRPCYDGGCGLLTGRQVTEQFRSDAATDTFELLRQQHNVLSAVARGIGQGSPWWNPLQTRATAAAFGAAVRIDDGLGVRALASRVDDLGRSWDVELDVRVVPGFWSPQTGYVHAYPEETAALLQALRDGTPLPGEIGRDIVEDLEPSDVRIMVLNGEGTSGLASLVADVLRDAGFVVAGTDNHTSFDVERTIIQTTASDEPRARLLAELLTNAEVEVLPRLAFTNVHIILVVGADRAGLRAQESTDSPSDSST